MRHAEKKNEAEISRTCTTKCFFFQKSYVEMKLQSY